MNLEIVHVPIEPTDHPAQVSAPAHRHADLAQQLAVILIVDPDTHQIHWLALTANHYEPIEHSALIELSPTELAQRIDWP